MMTKVLAVVCVVAVCVVMGVSGSPQAPIWPETFTISFNETASIPHIVTGQTEGVMYYDAGKCELKG